MMKTALFIGRFQPFHNGHLEDIKNILKECNEVIIGVGSSQYSDTKENPFSVEDRVKMIQDCLNAEGIENYTVFPVPDIHDDEKWVRSVIDLVPGFDIVFTGSEWIGKVFKKAGHKVKSVNVIGGVSGSRIRQMIDNGENWKDLVPEAVVKYVEEKFKT